MEVKGRRRIQVMENALKEWPTGVFPTKEPETKPTVRMPELNTEE
jgi:hypothetical protein